MTTAIISLFSIGAFDMLDPYGITTTLMLLQLVRKDWHVLMSVWVSYLTYWLSAIGVYYGVHQLLTKKIHWLIMTYPFETGLLNLAIGIFCLAGAILLGVRVVRNWSSLDQDISKVLFIRSVHPFVLAIWSVGSVWGNMTAAWPLFGYLGILVAEDLPITTVVILLAFFTFFSILPSLAVYAFYRHLEADRFAFIMSRVKKWLSRLCLAIIPVFLLAVSIWGFTEGFRFFRTFQFK